MAEVFPISQNEGREKKREADFNKVERIKQTLMKLEKSVISEADEGTQAARSAIKAMGFGITPILQTDDEDEAA